MKKSKKQMKKNHNKSFKKAKRNLSSQFVSKDMYRMNKPILSNSLQMANFIQVLKKPNQISTKT